MDDDTQRRMITISSTVLAGFLASKLADRIIKVPEERGVKDDVKEAVLKASFSVVSTIIASILVRQIVGTRR